MKLKTIDFKIISGSMPMFIGLALLAFIIWLTGFYIPVGWTADDGVHLRFSSVYSISQYLFNPDLLWIASYANLTPLLNIYYSLNLFAFGLDGVAWRIILSMLATVSVIAFYFSIKSFVHPWIALFAVALWSSGVPFFYTAATHMTSHYLLGMIGGGFCIWFFSRWTLQERPLDLFVSLAFYLVAIFSKEVYAPLPLIFLLFRPWCRVMRGLVAMSVIAIGYLIIRKWVLGTFIGGYQSGRYVGEAKFTNILASLPDVAALMVGGKVPAAVWGCTLLVLILFSPGKRGVLIVSSLLFSLVVLIPLLPLLAATPITQPDRYLFLASALLCALLGLAIEQVRRTQIMPYWFLILILGALLLFQFRALIAAVPNLTRGFNSQIQVYRLVLEKAGPMLIINSNFPADVGYWSQVLNAIREAKARLTDRVTYDRVMFASDPKTPVQYGLHKLGVDVYSYDASCNCLVNYQPKGEPIRNSIDVARDRTAILFLEDPKLRPENNQYSYGDSIQISRLIPGDDPKSIEIKGLVNLSTELDWLYIVLPNRKLPRLTGTGPSLATGSATDLQRTFHLRLSFDSENLAAEAMEKMCISVPAVRKTHYALLQHQPAYCSIFINDKLLQSQ
jgi:hypothetical protein